MANRSSSLLRRRTTWCWNFSRYAQRRAEHSHKRYKLECLPRFTNGTSEESPKCNSVKGYIFIKDGVQYQTRRIGNPSLQRSSGGMNEAPRRPRVLVLAAAFPEWNRVSLIALIALVEGVKD